MAATSKGRRVSYIAVPSEIIRSLSSTSLHSLLLLLSPTKKASRPGHRLLALGRSPNFLFSVLFFFALVGILRSWHHLDPLVPCPHLGRSPLSSPELSDSTAAMSAEGGGWVEARGEFWQQPDGMGYVPCLNFSKQYLAEGVTAAQAGRQKKYLLVVVSGGLNQQRNQIVDAVVIAHVLGATLVVPVLQVNAIWGDERCRLAFQFTLFTSVRSILNGGVLAALDSYHDKAGAGEANASSCLPCLDSIKIHEASELSKDLPPDLQKLRCKLAMRMRSKGPYLALHLRLEKDVWVRTGCLPGLSPEHDEIVRVERKLKPELLTGRSNMAYHDRKLAGLCPLNAAEPFGGRNALLPLMREFPNLYSKEDLTLPGELEPFANRSSLLAAIDDVVCEQSDVFMASHGGNMGHLMRGQRAYAGHRKFITPNKRQMLRHFLNAASLPESELHRIVKELHRESLGQPELRTDKIGRDVTAYPLPECMCEVGARMRSML
ncbi:hypothetical protein BHE74_00022182 [Ensete ventricosum]|nr:hypothetical protein BHE74_00022182 [Ensete ventricosum]